MTITLPPVPPSHSGRSAHSPPACAQADCAAVSGCSWVDLAQACTVAMDVVERMMLDPKDM